MKILNKNAIIFFFLPVVAILMYFLNLDTPILRDDCYYSINVNSISDIIKFQFGEHYQTMNGRAISHTIVQFMAVIVGKGVFNFLNAIMFSLFIYFIYKHIETGEKANINSLFLLFTVFFVAWFLLPDQYATMLMIAGSLNYLWSSVLVLGYILLFTKRIALSKSIPLWQLVGFFLISLLTGAFVEFYSVAVFPALIVWLLINKIKFNKAIIVSLSGFFVGLLFVVLAPGNFVRLDETASTTSLIKKILVNFPFHLFVSNYIWIIILLIAFFYIVVRYKKGFSLLKENILYISGIVFLLGFICLSGAWWSRVFFPFFIFSLILFFRLITLFKWNRIAITALSLVMLICFMFSYQKELKNIRENKRIYDDLIVQLHENNNDILVQKCNFIGSKMTFGNSAFSIQKETYNNLYFAEYHQHSPVSVLPKNIYDSLYIEPFYIQKKFEVFENVYTASSLHYYIIPIDTAVNHITNVELIYSEKPVLQLKAKMDYLFSDTFIERILIENKNVKWIKKIFFNEAPLIVNYTYSLAIGPEPSLFVFSSMNNEKYLLVMKNRYKNEVLSAVNYNLELE